MSRAIEDCNILEKYEEKIIVVPPKRRPVVNFSAGPAKLPESALVKAQLEFREFEHTGISILEMSHRSKEFTNIIESTKKLFRDLMSIPDNYDILFMQGGGTGQFAAIPLNLMGEHSEADYLVTGVWSKKGAKEGSQYLKANNVIDPPLQKYTRIPPQSNWKLSPDAAFIYYCANETVNGVEFRFVPESKWGVPLVADVSSNILSKPIDVSKHGIVFAGTQKNIGTAGLTVVIIRKDLLGHSHPFCPTVFNYNEVAGQNSVLNTPPVYSIYLTKLVLEWIRDKGGADEMDRRSKIKSDLVYNVVDDSCGFYHCPVSLDCRSRMNIPFRIGGPEGDMALEKKFIEEAEMMDMISLKGHRSVGGIRASLYNAVNIEETQKLADYMREFMELNSKEE